MSFSWVHISFLQGSLTRDFRLQVFSWISFPRGPEYTNTAISNFYENSQRYSQFCVYRQCRWHRRLADHRWTNERNRRWNSCKDISLPTLQNGHNVKNHYSNPTSSQKIIKKFFSQIFSIYRRHCWSGDHLLLSNISIALLNRPPKATSLLTWPRLLCTPLHADASCTM